MKTSISILLGAAAILTGCVVTSVCPYYTQKDLVSERALLGSWTNLRNPQEVWTFQPGEGLAYRFTIIEAVKATVMEAHAFKIHDQLFLDLFSLDRDYHVIPAHYLLRVTDLEPTLRLSELNQTWLEELLAKNPDALRHHVVQTGDRPEDRRIVLIGDTAELQKFIGLHLKTAPAWKNAFELKHETEPVKTAQIKDRHENKND